MEALTVTMNLIAPCVRVPCCGSLICECNGRANASGLRKPSATLGTVATAKESQPFLGLERSAHARAHPSQRVPHVDPPALRKCHEAYEQNNGKSILCRYGLIGQ
jgi:hypothetical protein